MPDDRPDSQSSRSHHHHRTNSRRDSRSRSPDENRSSRRHRDRSRSPRRDTKREHRSHRDRRRDQSVSEDEGPPDGVDELGEEDYFLKATELKLWLYFKKFCRAWNRGRLSDNYYAGISPASLPSSISTSHTWSFSKATQRELDDAASVRKSIDTGSKTKSYSSTSASVAGPRRDHTRERAGPTMVMGPTMPPSSAVERLQLERDAVESSRASERAHAASRRKLESHDARAEERDSRATGRDRLLEKRREGNQSRREFETSREGGGMVEVGEDVLLGQGGGFQEALRERERQRERREGRRGVAVEEKKAVMSDKLSAFRQKEDATMAMFRSLAAQRFGGPSGGG
ncbi:hypothetical protein JCM21900_005715 [Sporobolomyces salmonicolor]